MKKIIAYSLLILISLTTLLLTLPTINDNVDKPNLIPYFNSDEGGLTDLLWSYYSGEKRKTFQWDADYGLEMVYLADFSRLFLSSFMRITPGVLILMLRWLHLAAWIASFFVLFRLVMRHFGSALQAILAVALLAVRPAFAYLQLNTKPEPLVLLIMLIGLDYSLRMVGGKKPYQHLFIAVCCAVLATLVKYAGIFLLPAIVTAMFYANRYKENTGGDRRIFPDIGMSWMFPAVMGLVIVILPLVSIFTYESKTFGTTWYEQYGFFSSLLRQKLILYMCVAGTSLVLLSCVIPFLNKTKNRFVKKVMTLINEMNSNALIVFGVTAVLFVILGFKWIINPGHFINSYAQMGSTVEGLNRIKLNDLAGAGGLLYSFVGNIIDRITILGPTIVLLFVFYIIVELCGIKRNLLLRQSSAEESREHLVRFYKRLVLLLGFLAPFWLCMMFSAMRMAEHNVLPFFAVTSILSIQGIVMFKDMFNGRKLIKNTLLTLISVALIASIFVNAYSMISSRAYQFRRHEDIAYEIGDWWRKNIPAEAKIVADHYKRVYVPSEYSNIRTLGWNEPIQAWRIAKLVKEYHPEFVYYNARAPIEEGGPMPPIEEVLPDMKTELVKSFENTPGSYSRNTDARLVIYRILYEEN